MKAPPASSLNALNTMRANRRVSGLERTLRQALWHAGSRGYRLRSQLPGHPDIVYPVERIAILVHGCFWHSCPECRPPRPKANSEFWATKLERNVVRDAEVERLLGHQGWSVMVVWEHDVRQDLEGVVRRIGEHRARRRVRRSAEAGDA
jgi:DNA mismatch endonuclease (patch repair protein)